jgi:DNA-3-methyladenine glycosylase II
VRNGSKSSIGLQRPYRLDLTVDALRRLSANVVDRFDAGCYRRALSNPSSVNVLSVRQAGSERLEVYIGGRNPHSTLPVIRKMLGTDTDLGAWYGRAREFPWIARLAKEFRGLRPPCYPTLWEALCHGIVFQQLSIVAASSIMRRFVLAFSRPVTLDGVELYPFPSPESVAKARRSQLQAAGLSRGKTSYICEAAGALLSGAYTTRRIGALPTPVATAELRRLHGIGPWSAAVILLRGLGRLDAFPLNDSGVRRSIAILSGSAKVDVDRVLEHLGDMRGMLYFHLLLGMRRRVALLQGG